MTSVRVLHVIQTLKGAGAEKQVRTLLPLLKRGGVEAGAVTIYPSGLTRAEAEQLGVPLIDIGAHPKDLSLVLALVGAIRRFSPDIVHTHTHVGKYWGRIAARLAGIPIIVHTEHNPCDPRRNLRDRIFDRLLGRSTTRVVTFLEEQRETLARIDKLPPEKITIIPNALPAVPISDAADRMRGRELLGVRDDEYAVLVVARMEFQKNLQLAIDAFGALPPELASRSKLFFVGSGSLEPRLRARVAELGMDANIHFMGQRSDVQLLLAGADVLFMTSRFEGMPIVFIEAMATGLAMVTTPWIGARTMLDDGRLGFISPSWTVDDVSRTLAAALADDDRRAEVARLARERVGVEYDMDHVAERYLDLYRSLVGSNGAVA